MKRSFLPFSWIVSVLVAACFVLPGRLSAQEPASAPVVPSAPVPVADPKVPPAMTLGVAMTSNSPDSITLEWYRAPLNDATDYNVYVSDKTDGEYTKVATVKERKLTHTGLKAGTSYFYKVAATNPNGEGPPSAVANGFTIAAWEPKPFPVKIAKNMCVSLGATVICNAKPISGTLANLVDGSDITGCRLRKAFELKIKLNPDLSITDADYLMLHFRTDCSVVEWSNDRFSRTLKKYSVIESSDSTNGEDGTWKEVLSGTNELLDGVIVIPNHQPKWVGIRSEYLPTEEMPKAEDRRPMPSDLILCRLDIFRSAPAGFRNDYWIITGDSLVVGDLPGGAVEGRDSWFSDLIRKKYPDRYPIVVHVGRGGQMLKDTLPAMQKALEVLSPPNGTSTPTGTIVCWETGFNDVGVGGSLGLGTRLIKSFEAAQELCLSKGLFMVPVRIEYSNYSLNPETLEPLRYNVFYNTLAVNLGGVDVFARNSTPYACDPKTNLPYADYWTYTRANHQTALNPKDGVHHTPAGADGINRLWAEVAGKMIYEPQK